MADLYDAMREALTKPSHFAYYGDDETFVTWGFTLAHHRDSDLVDESNWQVITEDILKHYPDDARIESASHWAVGWIEHLVVRVLREGTNPAEYNEDDATEAFRAVFGWAERLENYPLADEDHYSSLEHDDCIETLTECYGVPDSMVGVVFSELFDTYSVSRGEELTEDMVEDVMGTLLGC